jgi:hypothetical protein
MVLSTTSSLIRAAIAWHSPITNTLKAWLPPVASKCRRHRFDSKPQLPAIDHPGSQKTEELTMSRKIEDEQQNIVLTFNAIAEAENEIEAISHAFNGVAELLLAILYELRTRNSLDGPG